MLKKREVNHMLKKSAAIVTASVMVMAVPVTAMADGGSYNEREKAALKSLCEIIAADWDESVALMAENENAANAEMELKLTAGDTGKAMLGMMTGMDFSWLNNASMKMNASVADSRETVLMNVLLNDSNICSVNMMVNMMEMMEYIQIPELNPAWLKMDMNQALDEDSDSMQLSMQLSDLMTDPETLFASGSEISDILERYGNIVIDHIQDGASVEETISIDGISEDCTMLEGLLYQEDAQEMLKEILTTAQTDEQIQELLTRWSEALPDAGDLNEQFQSAVGELLEELEYEPAEDAEEGTEEAEEYIASRIWVNAEDEIIGREYALCEGVNDTDNVFTWKSPKSGDASGLLLEFKSDGSGFAVTGSGQTTDGALNGNYRVEADGVTVMEVAVENYNGNADGEGYPAGTFTVTFPDPESEEEYNPLSTFSLVLTLSSSQADNTVDMNLALLSSGASLCDLSIHVAAFADAVESVSEDSMETVCDMMNEDDMNAYSEALSFDTIRANAEAAGMPAEVIEMIEQSMAGSEEEIEILEEYDGEYDETTEEEIAADEAA